MWSYGIYLCCGMTAAAGVGLIQAGRKGARPRRHRLSHVCQELKRTGKERISLTIGQWNERTSRMGQTPHWIDKTPLGSLRAALRKNVQRKMDMEIYEAISYLRNVAVLGEEQAGQADSIIERLAQRPGQLSGIYWKMLQFLRVNQKEEAVSFFSQAVDTPIGKDFGRLLIQWDEIHPKELAETLLSHQKSMKEMRITEQKRKDAMISDLIYLPVIVNAMLIFVNFIYVAYFLDQKETLSILF